MITESTPEKLRKTGISTIGEVPWGTHFCCFYETKQDLLETLVLYFKAGLENKEFCVWVLAQALTIEEAKQALGKAVPDLDRHLAQGALEIHSHADWYLRDGRWHARRVLQSWGEKLNHTLTNGYAGLRASGDGGWTGERDWIAFREYEKEVDWVIADQRSIILCTYPLTTSTGDKVFDVAHIHQRAVARRNGTWETIETSALKEAKAEIKRLNQELEQKVVERTRELAAANAALRNQIVERQLAVESVKEAEDRTRLIIDTIPTMAWSLRADGVVDFVNQRWVDYTGVSFQDAIRQPNAIVHSEDLPKALENWLKDMAAGRPSEDEMRLRRADGEYRWFLVRTVPLRDSQEKIIKWYGTSSDIEDRKQAEMQARTLIDAIPQQIWSAPPDGKTDYCNERWRSYTGLELENLRGYGWLTMLHPDDRDRVLKAWDESVANGMPYEQEERHRGTDGTYRWFLSLAVPLRDVEGRIVRWYGTNTDIEDRKRAEEALRKSEKLFAAFMDHLPGFAWMKDLEGRYVWVNKKESELEAYHDGVAGKTDAELWPSGIASAYRANDQQVITTRKELQAVEPSLVNGEQSSMMVCKFPILDPDGSVVMVAGVGVDITDLIQAEQALDAQALRYKTLMETSMDSIYVLDENGDLQEANTAFLRRRGYTAAEAKGLNVMDWDTELDRDQLQERIRKLVDSSEVFDTRHRCKDGSVFHVEVSATAVRINGEQLFLCVARDITERKQAAAALATRARHQAVVAGLGRLALAGGELQWLFDQTVARVAETLEVEHCKVLELLPDGDALKLVAGVGWKEGRVGQATVGVERDSQAGYTMLTRDLVVVEDLRTETRFHGPALLREHGVVSGLSVIIGDLEKPFGVLGAHTTRQRRFTTDDAHFFQSVANVLAEAIQRKRAEAQAGQLAAIVESSADAIIGMDLKGIITSWNRGAEKIFTYTAEEMLGGPIRRLIPPDRRAEEEQVFSRIRRGENAEHFETVGIEKGGAQIDLSLTVSPIRNAAGDMVGASLVARDITERKTIEKALESAKEQYRSIFDNAVDGIFRTSPDGKLLVTNRAAARIFGFASPEESIEARWDIAKQAYVDPARREELKRLLAEQGVVKAFEFEAYRKDGSRVWISENARAVRSPSGEILYFEGIFADITERKQAEEARERGLSLMLATLESTADGILVVNTEGKIVAFNRLFARMWRLPDEVLASKVDARALECVLDQLVEPEKFLEKVRYLYRHPEEESFDRLLFKDGRVFERYSRPQLIGGKVAGRVWSNRDVTERRRAAEELEEANKQLRILSRQLFHIQEEERRHLARELHDEIGQTLTAAKINLKIIAPDVPANIVGRLDDSVQLLDRLLRQVRQLSLDLRPPLLDELGLVPTLRWLVDQQAQRAGLRVTFTANVDGLEIDPDVQTACFRVAQEGITNIIRHAGAKSVSVELRRESQRLWLSVRDDGAGFDPAAIEKEGAQHSSLGLVSMKERALLVGGGLELHSAPGQGTEIRAWFPLTCREDSSIVETA